LAIVIRVSVFEATQVIYDGHNPAAGSAPVFFAAEPATYHLRDLRGGWQAMNLPDAVARSSEPQIRPDPLAISVNYCPMKPGEP
jgi:hypothetical protein